MGIYTVFTIIVSAIYIILAIDMLVSLYNTAEYHSTKELVLFNVLAILWPITLLLSIIGYAIVTVASPFVASFKFLYKKFVK